MQIICTLTIAALVIFILICMMTCLMHSQSASKHPRITTLEDDNDEKRDFLLNDEDESMMENRLIS